MTLPLPIVRFELDDQDARMLRASPAFVTGFRLESAKYYRKPVRIEMMHKGAVLAVVELDEAGIAAAAEVLGEQIEAGIFGAGLLAGSADEDR